MPQQKLANEDLPTKKARKIQKKNLCSIRRRCSSYGGYSIELQALALLVEITCSVVYIIQGSLARAQFCEPKHIGVHSHPSQERGFRNASDFNWVCENMSCNMLSMPF